MKIRLGQYVYVICNLGISKVKVFMKGKDCFAHEEAFDSCFINEYRDPCYADEEGTRWFRKFSDAKKYILKENPGYRLIKERNTNYWGLEEIE